MVNEVEDEEAAVETETESESFLNMPMQMIIGLLIFAGLLIIIGIYLRKKSKRK